MVTGHCSGDVGSDSVAWSPCWCPSIVPATEMVTVVAAASSHERQKVLMGAACRVDQIQRGQLVFEQSLSPACNFTLCSNPDSEASVGFVLLIMHVGQEYRS